MIVNGLPESVVRGSPVLLVGRFPSRRVRVVSKLPSQLSLKEMAEEDIQRLDQNQQTF